MEKVRDILVVGSNGYIGSEFCKRSKYVNQIVKLDNYARHDQKGSQKGTLRQDYKDLPKDFLDRFRTIIWLAGHSSVPMAEQDPMGAIHNNLFGMINLTEKTDVKIIYASSGSVYSGIKTDNAVEDSMLGRSTTVYDYTKIAFDEYQLMKKKNVCGLRFGTVVGASQRFRGELLLNRMVSDALQTRIVNLANSNMRRPILFLPDLIRAIDALIPANKFASQIYNLCSINGTMQDYASAVAKKFGVQILEHPDTATYDFGMSNSLFRESLKFEFTEDLDLIIDRIKEGVNVRS